MPKKKHTSEKQLAFSLSTLYATKKLFYGKNLKLFQKLFSSEKGKEKASEKQLAKLPFTI